MKDEQKHKCAAYHMCVSASRIQRGGRRRGAVFQLQRSEGPSVPHAGLSLWDQVLWSELYDMKDEYTYKCAAYLLAASALRFQNVGRRRGKIPQLQRAEWPTVPNVENVEVVLGLLIGCNVQHCARRHV